LVSVEMLSSEVRELYPWAGEYLELASGDRLHYLDEGEGKPVLMVHGNPTWSFYYRNLVRELSSSYRCVAVDHMGCGLSDKPQDYPYTLQQHVKNLSDLIEHLELEDITLVVHDWGGPIGLGAALEHSEKISKIVIFNTGVFDGPLPLSIRMCRWPLLGAAMVRGLNGFVRVGLLRAISDSKLMKGAIGEGYLAPYNSWKNRIAHIQFIRDIPLEPNHPTRDFFLSIDARLKTFSDRPVLIIWGEQDFCFTPYYRKGFMERFPQAEVHALEDAAHWVVEDAHDRILPLLESFIPGK
jgi:pimeloyl-ACP methyl ester carboxylesterase